MRIKAKVKRSENMAKTSLIREVFFKENSSIASRKAVIAKLDSIDPNKVVNISEGYKSAVIMFDDGMDMLAFMVAFGLVKMRPGME